ncbi:MAG: ABC transporter ATP-binding protein [Deltaproteobacteria bacterium]|nr:ABC transporter ATP-binding protein [Deltaproteobacteria bacterium]
MIRVDALAKRFGKREVLAGLSLEITRGEVVGLLGPNGTGKSTLLNILAGLLRPDAGTVSVAGVDRFVDPEAGRRAVAYTPQVPETFRYLTVREHVAFVAAMRGLTDADTRRAYDEVAAELSLEAFDGQLIGELSHGSQLRVAVAAAWVAPTPVALYDESLAGLDPVIADTLARGVRRRADAGQAVLIASHDLDALARIADRAILLKEHRVAHTFARAEFVDGAGLARLYRKAVSRAPQIEPPPNEVS